MTDEIIARLAHYPVQGRALEYIRHTLAADAATRTTHGPVPPVDVERLFAAVELLIERHAQPWSPFVSTWTPGLESFSEPPSIRPPAWDLKAVDDAIAKAASHNPSGRGLSARFGSSRAGEAIAKAISGAIANARPRDVSTVLEFARRQMLMSLVQILYIEDDRKVEYLSPLLELAEAQESLTIATLNYDLSVEVVAGAHGVECDTGIDSWLTEGSFAFDDERGLRLLKLHGSIDWAVDEDFRQGTLPAPKLKTVDPHTKDEIGHNPAVVFGEAGKLRAEGPYLELLLAWANQLQRADSLLVVGYSFRDPHVNHIIARWFNDRTDPQIVLLDPGPSPGHGSNVFRDRLGALGVGRASDELAPFTTVSATAARGLSIAIGRAASVDPRWEPPNRVKA
jgi:hypothetical protein